MRISTAKLVYLALCLAAALTLSYVEALIPFNMGVPGAKIGLPNIVTLLLIYTSGPAAALIVGIMRVMLAGFMFGNLFAIAYSFSGLILSFISMCLIKRTGLFGIVGVSTLGGVMHNMGQLTMAALVTNTYILSYAPVLIICGVISGIVVGGVGGVIIGRLVPILRKSIYQS